MKKVLVFGTFDGIHDGHRHFLNYAGFLGEMLIVNVAADNNVQKLKGHAPKFSLQERMQTLSDMEVASIIVAGDEELGLWTALREYRPEIIALGYDQNALAEALEAAREELVFHFDIVRIPPHEPDKYKSSLLN